MHVLAAPARRTHDPRAVERIAREAAEVVDTPGFRAWYEMKRCEGAPSFPHFWAYARKSLTYDVPGRELAGLVWQATAGAFASFDASRGAGRKAVEDRFLTHWRYRLKNLVRDH